MSQTPEQRISQLEAELAALRGEMQDFTYTVSHDLRASLRHIVSYAHLVQEDAGPLLDAEVRGFLNTMTDSAKHMGVLMDGLMELSRLSTVPVSQETVPLQAMLEQACITVGQRYPAREVQWQLAQSLPEVQADASLLALALNHVLDNAVKFTAHVACAAVAVSAQQDASGNGVILHIQDNGAGFNPAMQDKLFRPFSRLHTARQFPGIGMGLAIARKALQRMGAAVSAHAQVEQGCTVQLVLRSSSAK